LKRLSTGVLAVLFTAGLGLNALAAPSAIHGSVSHNVIAQTDTSAPPADFGSPPSGSVPILYNDHHVYTKPDVLKQGRVLAALVRGGTVLIPLRSMFEQMGATVAYDASSKTVDVTKPGADVKVTVGKPEVVINGESRPLDVPPIFYQGQILVPVRVISEGMGAYVEWEPDKRLVVVRYLPATPPPPPTPVPTEAPTMAPTPAPSATPYKDLFVAGDYLISPKVYNEFSPGNTGSNTGGFSFRAKAAFEFDALNIPWMLEGSFTQINYPHTQVGATPTVRAPCALGNPACVTVIGGNGSTFVPAFEARDSDFTAHFGTKVIDPRVYVGIGYIWTQTNYGYPQLANWGYGASKLPDLNQPFTWYAEVWDYPDVKGTCGITVCPSGNGSLPLEYNDLVYDVGVVFNITNFPLFIEGGYYGDRNNAEINAPVTATHTGPYVGLGLKF